MNLLAAITPRLAVFSTSAVLHAGLFVIASGVGGHGPSAQETASVAALQLKLIDVAPIEEVVAPTTPTTAPQPEPSHHHHAHTHSYPVAPDHDATPHDPSLVHTTAAPIAPSAPAESPAVVSAPESAQAAPLRFTMDLGAYAGVATIVTSNGNGAGAGVAAVNAESPLEEALVSSPAKLLRGGDPAYPASARAQEIEADVTLEIVVSSRGDVASARVVRNAGYGFDAAAVEAVRAYRFTPALHDGQPNAVRMRWNVSFRLK